VKLISADLAWANTGAATGADAASAKVLVGATGLVVAATGALATGSVTGGVVTAPLGAADAAPLGAVVPVAALGAVVPVAPLGAVVPVAARARRAHPSRRPGRDRVRLCADCAGVDARWNGELRQGARARGGE
jgi:hypothetical protein